MALKAKKKPAGMYQAAANSAPARPAAQPAPSMSWTPQSSAAWTAASAAMAPQQTGLPFDAAREVQISGLEHDRNAALGGLDTQEADLRHDYWDPNDPLSKQNALREQFRQAKDAQRYGQAAQGRLYSGTAGTQRANTQIDEVDAGSRLQRDFDRSLGLIGEARGNADNAFRGGRDAILAESSRAFGNDPSSTPLPGDPRAAGMAAAATTPAGRIVVKPSAAHGGRPWRFRQRPGDNQLIPIGPA